MNSPLPLTLLVLSEPPWCVAVDAFLRERVAGEETMFTLANGHHGVRGPLEFARYLSGHPALNRSQVCRNNPWPPGPTDPASRRRAVASSV